MEIAEYSKTEAGLQELRGRLENVVYDFSITAGMTNAKADRRELVTLRTTLESTRKELKAPALQRCKDIDEEAKRITAEILKLEEPIDRAIKAEEKRKEEIAAEKERQRIAAQKALDEKIGAIKNLPLTCMQNCSTSAEISAFLNEIKASEFGGEFTGETLLRAEAAKQSAISMIEALLTDKIEKENREAREKEERQRLAEEMRQREEETAKAKAELEEKQRLIDLENDRIREEQKKAEEALRLEKEAFEAEQAKIRAEREAIAKAEAARVEAEQAAIAKQQREDAERRQEEDRRAAIQAEEERKAAEKKHIEEEKKRKLAEAKCATAEAVIIKIRDIYFSELTDTAKLQGIGLILEANQ